MESPGGDLLTIPPVQDLGVIADIPTNSKIYVDYHVYSGSYFRLDLFPLSSIYLVDTFGKIILSDVREVMNLRYSFNSRRITFLLTPRSNLKPNSLYRIQTKIDKAGCAGNDNKIYSCVKDYFVSVSSFTTGSTSDSVAPKFSGKSKLDTVYYHFRPTSCTNDDYKAVRITFVPGEINNELFPEYIRYFLYSSENTTQPLGEYESGYGTIMFCSGSGSTMREDISWQKKLRYGHSYVIRALDIAGNLSEPSMEFQFCPLCPKKDFDDPFFGDYQTSGCSSMGESEGRLLSDGGNLDSSTSQEVNVSSLDTHSQIELNQPDTLHSIDSLDLNDFSSKSDKQLSKEVGCSSIGHFSPFYFWFLLLLVSFVRTIASNKALEPTSGPLVPTTGR